MSYIVRASWWDENNKPMETPNRPDALDFAFGFAADCIYGGEINGKRGTVTITKDGKVIREYKVGEKE